MASNTTLPGRLGATVIGLIFAGMGLLFLVLMGAGFRPGVEALFWKSAPATIVTATVEKSGGSFRPQVLFHYEWEGRRLTSDRFSAVNMSHESSAAVHEQIRGLKPGARVTCRVNPSMPEEAVLRVGNLAILLFAVIPLVFVAVGAGMVIFAWRNPRTKSETARSSRKPSARAAKWLFGLIFTGVGGALLAFWFLPAISEGLASRNWIRTGCVIEDSRVGSKSDEDGTTYGVEITYRYFHAGDEYHSDRYSTFDSYSSGRDGKEEIVARYPAGAEAVCFVDPGKPWRAVLAPGVGWTAAFGLIPLGFFLAGLCFLVLPVWNTPPAVAERAMERGDWIKASSSPWGRLLGTIFVALFWNGIVAVFVTFAVRGFLRGDPEWFLTIFLIPFCVIGIGLIVAVGYTALTLANPRARIRLGDGEMTPGGGFEVTWEFTGAVHRLRSVKIFLEGVEEAVYRRGTSTATDREVFARTLVAEAAGSAMEMARGRGRARIPEGAMPTFRADNNRIVWKLCVRGDIPKWPNVAEEFPVVILPKEAA